MARKLSLLLLVGLIGALFAPPAAAGGGCHGGTKTGITHGTGTEMDIKECLFESTVLFIEPGDEVTWTNKDVFEHSVSGANYSWGSEELLGQGESVTHVFADEGVFPYYCILHPGMVGAVVVGDAAKGMALTSGGIPDITQKTGVTAATEPTSETETGSPVMAIGFAAIAALALTALATRTFAVRRRAASATPVP